MQTLTGWRTGFYLSQINFFDGASGDAPQNATQTKKVVDKIPQPFTLTIVILGGRRDSNSLLPVQFINPLF